MMNELQDRFRATWHDIGGPAAFEDRAFHALESAYVGRHYHTLDHVLWGLRRIEEIEAASGLLLGEKPIVDCAMFYHDAVMSFDGPSEYSDESLSAEFARNQLRENGVTNQFVVVIVSDLILSTAHQCQPSGRRASVLVDADLSILGAEDRAFDNYESLVRKEWSKFSDEEFRSGRFDVLMRFARMPRIFTTDYAHSRWEEKARANISRSMEKLSRP